MFEINKANNLLKKLDVAIDEMEMESHGEWVKLPSPAFTHFIEAMDEIESFLDKNYPAGATDIDIQDALEWFTEKRQKEMLGGAASITASLALSVIEKLYGSHFDFLIIDIVVLAFNVLNVLADKAD